MEQQILNLIYANFPSIVVSLIMFKVYQNIKQWADRIERTDQEMIQLKKKIALICKLHAAKHSEDALKIWGDEEKKE